MSTLPFRCIDCGQPCGLRVWRENDRRCESCDPCRLGAYLADRTEPARWRRFQPLWPGQLGVKPWKP